ncbi:MAG: hypothetical protein IPO32_10065 [Crocinitomicaceae bacterium]|nr:hypothetical protein [Crocinitomicaceae bacterium]
MRIFYFIPVFLIVFSCGNSTEEIGGEMKEFMTDAAPETDSSNVFTGISDSVITQMQRYFSSELIDAIETYVVNFETSLTDTALQQNYSNGIKLCKDIYDYFSDPKTDHSKELLAGGDIYSLYEELQYFNGKLGPLHFTCVAECTDLDICYDITIFKAKAATTNGKADDAFSEILHFVQGDFGYAGYFDFKVWDIQYWDYGGSNKLGDGTVLDVIKRIQKFETTHQIFGEQVALIRADVVDMLTSPHAYEYSLEEVLAEYNKIFKLNYFSGEELEAIQKQYNEIKSTPENFQFNCEEGNCTFG